MRHAMRSKRLILICFLLLVGYVGTRLLNLTALPIFTDEAIYIRWSQIGGSDANWRFISLTDGKQPLFTWLAMVTLRVIRDPLVAGRMVSVGAGVGTMIGLGVFSYELFKSRKISVFTMFLYVLSPFALWYDRLALYDSLSAAIAVWNLYLAVLLVRRVRLDTALLFGLMLGAGMLNKTSGFIAVYLLPISLLLFNWKVSHVKDRLLRWGVLIAVAFALSQLMYGVLRLSPFYHMIAQKDFVFVHPFKNWYFLYPFFLGNMRGLFDWITGYVTYPIFFLSLASLLLFWTMRKKQPELLRTGSMILIYCFLPMIGLAYFGKVLYPRFILFMAMPLLSLAAYTMYWSIEKWKLRISTVVIFFLLLLPSLYANYFIVTNPKYAPIPYADRGQMIDDWPSGWGVTEVNQFLSREASDKKVTVYTEGTFGLLPYAIEMYLVTNPNMTIKGIWPLTAEFPEAIAESASREVTYFVLNQTQIAPAAWPLEFIAEYQKGTNPDAKLRLYRVVVPYAYVSHR